MCSCGHDVEQQAEADVLKKKAVVTAAGAAAMAGIPAVFAAPGPAHHAILFGAIAVQVCLVGRALFLVRHRRQLLTCGREAAISR